MPFREENEHTSSQRSAVDLPIVLAAIGGETGGAMSSLASGGWLPEEVVTFDHRNEGKPCGHDPKWPHGGTVCFHIERRGSRNGGP